MAPSSEELVSDVHFAHSLYSCCTLLKWYCMCPELRELVKMHAVHQESNEEPLSYDEVLIVKVIMFVVAD